MASSAPRVAEAEREESARALDTKADTLVELIRKSKHFIVCTGAGVSTSADSTVARCIADFRGPNGVWTLRAQGKQAQNCKSTLQAIPTPTHMALVELQNRGISTYLISQNCDGLHRRSGILPDKILELHGNSNREYYFRAVSTYEKSIHDHRTGRICALCGGPLLDTVINFGESLFPEPLLLGSSLTVSPSDEIPETVGRRREAKLAICNLQSTPKDRFSDLRIFAKTDELMTRVMDKLGLSIPPFILRRWLLVVQGVDVDGTPATFLQSVRLDHNRRTVRSEPFIINFRTLPDPGTS
ncbi:NAD-dependent deacetylase sirtuin-7 [Xylaria sp. FL0064]|nr:NAD-dependent deacetylase sirtuin-7 [Xylaria sp. FL0064]